MSVSFEQVHAQQIVGTLTTVDRLIVRGHLQSFWFRGLGLARFLERQGLNVVRDFGGYVRQTSDRVIAHAKSIAAQARRPYIFQRAVVRGKDDLARQIARRDGITQGLICVLATVELATCFALTGGGRIVPRERKCLHLYFYVIDRDLGLMHIRLQTWFPFQIQIYVNGREWLARQLDRRRIGYVRYENTFLRIDDLDAARALCARFARGRWWRTFDALARRCNPHLPLIRRLGFGSYYWAIDACEVATDVMWSSRRQLRAVRDDLFDHALRTFSADDVIRFLGQKVQPWKGEVISAHCRYPARGDTRTEHRRRPEARRLKHRIRRNWIKMYDKWSVLRVETVINNPRDFRAVRFARDSRGRMHGHWIPMNKGIGNLRRYLQIGEAANRRYLDALAAARPVRHTLADLDTLCTGRVINGHRCPRLNPVAAPEHAIFQAVLAGEHAIHGFRNRDLQARLYPAPAQSSPEAKTRCSRVSRIIAKLRGHGLVAKVPASRLYRVTERGHRVMGLAIRFRLLDFPQALAA
jgi:hypothetical protein